MNMNKSSGTLDLRVQVNKDKPVYINQLLDAKGQIKISIGTNILDPQTCSNCLQKTKIVLRLYILIDGATESSEIHCFKCGTEFLNALQQDITKMPSMTSLEIITKDYKEILQEIKENFDEINIEGKDKNILDK